MLILVTTTDTLRVITSAVCDVDVVASHMDCSQASPPIMDQPETSVTNITTATTTTIVAAPGGTKRRNVKTATIRNAHASTPVDVTVTLERSATVYELVKMTLLAGETLEYIEGVGWFKVGTVNNNPEVYNASLAAMAAGFAADTYVTGSNLAIGGRTKAGTIFKWHIHMTKTAAGIATPSVVLRFGTAGAIGDTARVTMAGPAQTGVVDEAVLEIEAVVWTAGASGVVHGEMGIEHSAAVAAGFAEMFDAVTSSAFDLTVAGLQVGVSMNGGASAAWTVNQTIAEAFNLSA